MSEYAVHDISGPLLLIGLYQYDDKDFSLTDATSFAVMERIRVPYAFTFDRHFAQYGFTVLTAN